MEVSLDGMKLELKFTWTSLFWNRDASNRIQCTVGVDEKLHPNVLFLASSLSGEKMFHFLDFCHLLLGFARKK